MDFKVIIAARNTDGLLPGERHILLLLATHANGPDTPWPSVQTIASESGYTMRRVQQILHSLESGGVIAGRGSGGRGMTNSYTLLLHVNHEAGFSETEETTKPVSAKSAPNPEISERKPRNARSKTTKPVSSQEDVKKNVKITLLPRETGLTLLGDEPYCAMLRDRFPSLDFRYETDKWLIYIEDKPPKGNYKLSLQNWLERAVKFMQNGAQRNGTAYRTSQAPTGPSTDGRPQRTPIYGSS